MSVSQSMVFTHPYIEFFGRFGVVSRHDGIEDGAGANVIQNEFDALLRRCGRKSVSLRFYKPS